MKILMMFLSLFLINNAEACLKMEQLQTIEAKEKAYLLNRIPPAFGDAVQAGLLKMEVRAEQEVACGARLIFSLPSVDLDQARALLDADIAKKIMLNAQGYGLPETTNASAVFKVDVDKLTPSKSEVLQTSELGKLRASVELMYAILTQARAALSAGGNAVKWSSTYKQAQVEKCTAQNTPTQGCVCWAEALESKASEQQIRYQAYLVSNPYAYATGATQQFNKINTETAKTCGLTNKVIF